MRKTIIATIAAIMFVTASPAVAFAHGGGGNSGHGSGHDMRFDDHRDKDRFRRDFRNFNVRNNVSIFNNVTNSKNVRIRNVVKIFNRF